MDDNLKEVLGSIENRLNDLASQVTALTELQRRKAQQIRDLKIGAIRRADRITELRAEIRGLEYAVGLLSGELIAIDLTGGPITAPFVVREKVMPDEMVRQTEDAIRDPENPVEIVYDAIVQLGPVHTTAIAAAVSWRLGAHVGDLIAALNSANRVRQDDAGRWLATGAAQAEGDVP